ALMRLQKIMDEYAAGPGSYYLTNRPTLERGLELMSLFKSDLEKMAARDLHELLRCWEVIDRFYCAEAHMRHLLFREETRWPGYYYRGDFPSMDEENWKCFTNSKYDQDSGEWSISKKPFLSNIP
ncbi:MAG: adenylyl-sulfate reductase subunit alpha, partial [Chloroflexota bacterium]